MTEQILKRTTFIQVDGQSVTQVGDFSLPPPEPPPDPPPPDPPPDPPPPDTYPTYADRQATILTTDDWDAIVSANAAGTLFGVARGVHLFDTAAKQFTVRANDRFVGETDAAGTPISILKGNWNGTQTGTGLKCPFTQTNDSLLPSGVKLYRLDVQYFAPEYQQTTIGGGASWIMYNLHVHHNKSGGVRIGTNAQLLGGKVYRNGQIGLKQATGANNGVADGVEVYENNYWDWNAYGGEAGGMKFAGGEPTNMVIRRCHFHHNHGPGIWYDFAGAGGFIEDNVVEDNLSPGIFYELSNGAGMIIRRNAVRRNAGAADIYVANSTGLSGNPIRVEDNVIEDPFGHAGIWCKDDAARFVRLGYVEIKRNRIRRIARGNVDVVTGSFGSNGGTGIAPGMVWEENNYYTDIAIPFQHGGVKETWTQWKSHGFDTPVGTLNPYSAW